MKQNTSSRRLGETTGVQASAAASDKPADSALRLLRFQIARYGVVACLGIALGACGGDGGSPSATTAQTAGSTPDSSALGPAASEETPSLASGLQASAPPPPIDPALASRINLSAMAQRDDTASRFIVRYRAGTAQRRDPNTVSAWLGDSKRTHVARARHLRRLSTGGDVIVTDRALGRADATAFLQTLANDPNVEYAEVDAVVQAAMVPNDSLYSKQWGFPAATANSQWKGGTDFEHAWDLASGNGQVLAMLDNGVTHHADLDANILPGIDILNGVTGGDGTNPGLANPTCGVDWHGTHVAGTLAAVTNNSIGVAGSAWGAKVVPVRVLNPCSIGFVSDVADGIAWALGDQVRSAPLNTHPASVINMSLEGMGRCSFTYQNAIDMAVSRGVPVVIAAGNYGKGAELYQPASCHHAIVAGASNANADVPDFSDTGPLVALAAPGVNVYSTWNAGTSTPGAESYAYQDGTSMAAPHIAGAIALMQSVAPQPLLPGELRTLLMSTARPFAKKPVAAPGVGILDARSAVEVARSGRLPPAADFSFSDNQNLQLTFTDTSTARGSTIVSRVWNFGDGSPDVETTSTRPYRNYAFGGDRFVTLTVTDNRGVSSTISRYITVATPFATVLSNGVAVKNLTASTGQTLYYRLNVPAGATSMSVSISGGTGDANLQVRRDTPSLLDPLCAPFLSGNDETCTFDAPPAGAYYVMLYGYAAFSGVTLVARYTS